MKETTVFLLHILDSIKAVEEYTAVISKKYFLTSQEKQDSILRRIEIIGEAVRHIPADYRNKYPEVLWRQIAGTRDKIIHDYFDVDLELVWEVIKKDLPKLKKQLSKLVKSD